MMNITDFLKTNTVSNQLESEIIISDRFKNENGENLKFKIRSLTTDEVNDINRMNEADKVVRIVATGVTEPNFKDVELQNKYSVIGESALIKAILLPGEIVALSNSIYDLSGYGDTIDKLIKEAKKH